ncbi:MAG: hypothetical protein ACR2IH_03100 [Pyrinomonadaceae bacterium]
MVLARNILAVVAGYLIFAVSAVLLFKMGDFDPHAEASVGMIVLVVVFGSVFSFIGGYIAKRIAASDSLGVNAALAVLMFSFAAFSSVQSSGSHYTQFAAMAIFAPVSFLAGYVGRRTLSQH